MKFSTEDLKNFKTKSAFIKQNATLSNPILNYLKFEKDAVIKNNLKAFYRQTIECNHTFLVDEKILMAFVENTEEDTIDITIKGKSVIISDGKTNITSPTDDPKLFPEYDKTGGQGEAYNLSADMISIIGMATSYIDDDSDMGPKGLIFIGSDLIAGSNGGIAIAKSFPNSGLPTMVLRKEAASAVSLFTNVAFSENPSYQFFDTGTGLYGFSKPEYRWIDLSKFATFEQQDKNFAIDKTGIIQFNKFCLSASNSKVVTAKMEVGNNKANLRLNDSGFELEIKVDLDCQGMMDGHFNYNPEFMNKLLTNYPDQLVKVTRIKETLYFSGASEVTALIMGVI